MKSKLISIIIPTLNEEKYIQECLKSIKNQDYSNFEVIVVDSYSDDKTLEIVKNFDVKIVRTKKKGIGHARNVGAKIAKGEYLCFIDADTSMKKNYLTLVLNSLKNHDVSTCFFELKPRTFFNNFLENTTSFAILLRFYLKKPLYPGFCTNIKKSIFDKEKGFKNVFGEDEEFSTRLKKYKQKIIKRKGVITSDRRLVQMGAFGIFKYYFFEKKYVPLKN